MSIIKELKNIKSGKKELRNFGLLIAGVLFIIAAVILFQKKHTESDLIYYLLSIAGFLFIFGLILPKILWPLQKIWMGIAVVIGYFISRIILTLFFFLIITPAGWFLKLLGKDLLNLKINNQTDSYWIEKEKKEFSQDRYEKQF